MNTLQKTYEDYWSKDHGVFSGYVRNLALENFFNKGEFVLDVGCGDGIVAEFIRQKTGLKPAGMDISQEAVAKAKEKGIDAKIASSEEKFPFDDNTFDKVFWGDNIEHLFDPEFTLKEIRRVLRSNGKLVLSCPNMAYWRYRFGYFLKGALNDTEWTGAKPWEWTHIRFFNLEILKELLKKCGFNKITKTAGVSERRLDKPFLKINPALFGMILILEAE